MTDPDLKLLQDKYGKLVTFAAMKIGGDKSQSTEDYEQAIWALILYNVPRYLKRERVNSVEEFMKSYDGWIKQWIWSYKNGKGAENTRHKVDRKPISLGFLDGPSIKKSFKDIHSEGDQTNAISHDFYTTSGFHYETVAGEIKAKLTKTEDYTDSIFIKELEVKLTPKNKVALAIINDPEVFKQNGVLNYSALSRVTGIPLIYIPGLLKEIKDEYKT